MRLKKPIRIVLSTILAACMTVGLVQTNTYAADDTDITQVINSGTLTTDIRNASRVTVANPTFAMSTASFSFECQTLTGSLGSDSQRIYVDNPDTADNGWTLTIAATSGATGVWSNSGVTQTFDYNDPTTAGCTDGGDADSVGGQLTLDPSAGTLATDCSVCVVTNVSRGTSTAFNQAVTDSVTLLNASAGSDDIGRWYITGIGISQTIPAQQPVDSYSINLTITATAS